MSQEAAATCIQKCQRGKKARMGHAATPLIGIHAYGFRVCRTATWIELRNAIS